jgi:hypothetical protein
MKKYILITACLFLIVPTSLFSGENWYKFFNQRELSINSPKGQKNFKLHGTPFNPKITEKGTLLFGTGAGYIYAFDHDGLIHSHEEKGIFYHVFEAAGKIVALSGTPLNAVGEANIIIFSSDFKKRNVLFSTLAMGQTFVTYWKNGNLILTNIGGFYGGNEYSVIDIVQEKIIWQKGDVCSLMLPYKKMANGFEFIDAEPEEYTTYHKNGNLDKRYFKIKNIYIYRLTFANDKVSSERKLKTNLVKFIDKTKTYSDVAAYCEDKFFNENSPADFGYQNYLDHLSSTGEILIKQFPKLKEIYREEENKVIFKAAN